MFMATSLPLRVPFSRSPAIRCSTSDSQQLHPSQIFFPLKSHCFAACLKKWSKYRFMHPPRTSLEGVPSELAEDPKFVPLNADDPVYGPPALLLLGFEANETHEIQKLLRELDGEFLKVIHCTEEMFSQTVWDAVNTELQSLEAVKIAKSVARICILSGLSGEEMMMFIDAFPETGLKPTIFAALVPNSANKLLSEVIEEIVADHEMLSANDSS